MRRSVTLLYSWPAEACNHKKTSGLSCWALVWLSLEWCLNLVPSLLLSRSSATFHTCKKSDEKDGAKGESHYFDLGLVKFPCIRRSILAWLEYLECRRTNRGQLEKLYCNGTSQYAVDECGGYTNLFGTKTPKPTSDMMKNLCKQWDEEYHQAYRSHLLAF